MIKAPLQCFSRYKIQLKNSNVRYLVNATNNASYDIIHTSTTNNVKFKIKIPDNYRSHLIESSSFRSTSDVSSSLKHAAHLHTKINSNNSYNSNIPSIDSLINKNNKDKYNVSFNNFARLNSYSTDASEGESSNHPIWSSGSVIEKFASIPYDKVTLNNLLIMGREHDKLTSAHFAYTELPKRMARRVKSLQNLPFIVGMNPHIKSLYKLYRDSFFTLRSLPEPVDEVTQKEFTTVLTDLVESHSDVIPILAKGFKECIRYLNKDVATKFLDEMIQARIGIRIIAEHHLNIALATPENPNNFGIVTKNLSPKNLITTISYYVQQVCDYHYGISPEFEITGHTDTKIAYIEVHLEYIFMELMKNAMRATVEYSNKIGRIEQPPIEIAICKNENEITIRIRDNGGGISAKDLPYIFDYSYTTVKKDMLDNSIGDQGEMNVNGIGGPIAGLGFGLPMSRIYASYFGGSLDIRSLTGHGCDVFLTIPNIIEMQDSVKIQ